MCGTRGILLLLRLAVVLEQPSKTHTAKWARFHIEPLPRAPSLWFGGMLTSAQIHHIQNIL